MIFSWPGVGQYLATAIAASDLAAITGVVLVLGVAYVTINFVVDILQVIIDPRQREAA
jgi:peptide/nickel transport system permease protein